MDYNYRDFYYHLVTESMTVTIPSADNDSKDLENMLGLSFVLARKVVNPILNKMSEWEKEFFQTNRAMEVLTPDGDTTFKPIGIMNFYISGLNEETVKKIVAGVKYYASEIGLGLGAVSAPEQSKMMKSKVIRIPVVRNDNVGKAPDVPEIQFSNMNARLIFDDVLQLPDFDEGYTIAAFDLLDRINQVLKKVKEDDEYLYRVARPENIDQQVGKATMISGGADPDYILKRLGQLKELCEYALENGFRHISVG